MRHLLPLLLLAGCEELAKDTGEETYDCSLMAVASVQLTLLDPNGSPLEGATVTYAKEGVEPEACQSFEPGEYVCGHEVAGDITIAMDAEGFAADEIVVTVLADECHVQTQQVTHTLDYIECTEEEVPGVLVYVTDVKGADVLDADVTWWTAEEEALACDSYDGANTWACAPETSGDVTVRVYADFYEPYEETVTVGHDECHVITEEVDAVLDFQPF